MIENENFEFDENFDSIIPKTLREMFREKKGEINFTSTDLYEIAEKVEKKIEENLKLRIEKLIEEIRDEIEQSEEREYEAQREDLVLEVENEQGYQEGLKDAIRLIRKYFSNIIKNNN